MTLSKQLLGVYHRLVLVRVYHLSKTVLIVDELLTAQRGPVARDLLCLTNGVLVGRLFKILMTTLTAPRLLETGVESFEGLISALALVLVSAMGNRAIICAVGWELVHLLELVGGVVLIVLDCVMLSKRYLLIAVVTELLLRA